MMRATLIYVISMTLMVLINNHVQAQDALISTPSGSGDTTVISPVGELSTTTTTLKSIVIITSTSTTSNPSTTTSTTSNPLTSTSTTSIPTTPITSQVPGEKTTSTTPNPSPATTPIPFPVINTTINFPSNEGKWMINFTTTQDRSCIIVQGAIQLTFSEKIPSGINSTTSVVDVPIEAVAVGKCDAGNGTSTLKLLWSTLEDKVWKREDSLEFLFALKEDDTNGESYAVSNLTFTYIVFNSSARLEESSGKRTADGPFFETKLNSSYLCTTYQNYQGGSLNFETEFLQIEAFRSEYLDRTTFNEAKICDADMTATAAVIGIVIGSILALLVGVSIGAYLGTRYGYFRWPCCNRADGYSRLDI